MITTKSKLKQIIKEELAIAEYQTDRQYGQSYTSVNLRDPYAVDGELHMLHNF